MRQATVLLASITMLSVLFLWSVGAATKKPLEVAPSYSIPDDKAYRKQEQEARILRKALEYCRTIKVTDAAILACVQRETL